MEAKIQQPLISSEFVHRERLIARMKDESKRLVLLHAPMGYGKTVLLTQYAQNAREDCVWYHLSDMDNDGVLFMQYLSASIKKSFPAFDFDFQDYAPLLQEEDAFETMIHDFAYKAGEAVSASGRGAILILDDFQVINCEDIYRVIRLLLDHTGKKLRIMIATKGAVPPFCIRYLLDCKADVLTVQELSFTLEEVQVLLYTFSGGEEISGLAETIWGKAEGWPAGVMFACLYLKQQRIPAQAESALSNQKPAMDAYFMHELFKKLPYDIQTFLVNTSSLEFLSVELCNSVLHISDAQSVLDYLEQENLFISKVGQSERLFRYHTLFKDFLTTMLDKEAEREILTKAAEFYLSTPDKALAVEYALAGGNWDLMQYALESVGQELLEQGKLNTLERWIVELEINRIVISPKNMLWMGSYFYRTGQTAKATSYLDQALPAFLASMDETGYICCMLEKARVARNQVSLEESCQLIEAILPRLHIRYNQLWYAVIMERLYNFILMGRYREALAICSEMILSARKAGNQKAEGLFMRFSTVVNFYMGKYQKSLKLYQDLLEYRWISKGEEDLFSVEAYLALMYLFTGQEEEALNTIKDELGRGVKAHQKEDVWLAYLIQAYICLNLTKDEDDAQRKDYLLREAENSISLAERHVSLFKQNAAYVKSVLVIRELAYAIMHPEALIKTTTRILQAEKKAIPLIRAMALSALADLLCDNGEWGQAKAVAGRCLAKKEWEDAFTFSVRATLARISQQEGNEEENAAHRAKMESYDQEGQLDWRYLSKHKQEYAAKLLRQPADRGEGVKVTCFGHFQVQMPGATEEVRWRTKKTQELFAYLFHLQGQPVDKETILLQLWPDLDHESATSLLHTTLYNIRKALPGSQSENLIVYGQKKYAMNMELILSPLDKMNRLCQAMGIRDEDFIYNCRDTLRSCRGEYLGGVACNFAAAPRAYFEQKFLRLCHIAASQCMERRQWEEAVSLLDMAIEADPYEESLYDLILRCFHEMKDVKRIKLYYTRLRDLLREELGVEPSDEVAAAYRLCLYNGADRQNVVGTSA